MCTDVVCETREMHTGLWWEDLKERAHLKDRRVDGTMIINIDTIYSNTTQLHINSHLHTNNTENDTKQTIHRTTQKYIE
jgi:hypothetical protein